MVSSEKLKNAVATIEEELNRRRLEELQRKQREVERELEIEKIKQSDDYKNYLKLKDKFSSIDRSN